MFEKLIRDRIPDIAALESRVLPTRLALSDELDRFFGLKLLEESQEVIEAMANFGRQELIDEIADLQTVIDDLAFRKGITKSEVDSRVESRRSSRGGFSKGLILHDKSVKSRRLHVGGATTLVDAICKELLSCVEVRIAVAFIMRSGLDLLEGPLRAALLRGVNIQLLTTDYLGVTEPEALERMLGWAGHFEARVYSHERRSFHPKAYLFRRSDGSGRAFIGSANMSRMGLREGVEWTWTVLDVDAGQPMAEIRTRFDEMFACEAAKILTPALIAEYRTKRPVRLDTSWARSENASEERPAIEPREVQSLALAELVRLRADGQTKALVVAATGLGKTYLAAFDAIEAGRVLFIAHREELLIQAAAAFEQIYPRRSKGFVMHGRTEFDCDCVFASIQTLSRPEHLARAELTRFDYVVIDEFHHAAADSYQRVLQVLRPAFLLGLTATPFRGDNRDLLELCGGNLAYQVGLFEAIAFGWLAPFRYYGLADVVDYSADLLTPRKTYDICKLTVRFNTDERAQLVIKKFRQHACRAGLGFCVSIEHADFMAAQFRKAGIGAAAVHSGPASTNRIAAVRQLGAGELTILFTVDMFNEGVDIPAVDLVMFLRPTESMVVFLQQLGRGLRLHSLKPYLTVLDFIGNYRNAHFKLAFLAGQDLTQNVDPKTALTAVKHWLNDGVRPGNVPDGVTLAIEPIALTILQASFACASPLKQLVLDDLADLAERLARAPHLAEFQRLGRYPLSTARTALGVDRWNWILQAGKLLTDDALWLEGQIGDFLRDLEKTQMTKSYKMVVILAMCRHDSWLNGIHISDLIRSFRDYFSAQAHRSDVVGTAVENVEAVQESTWQSYLLSNPIGAWTTANKTNPAPYFSWNDKDRMLRYIGPMPVAKSNAAEMMVNAIRDRATAQLQSYWVRPGPGKYVFDIVPAGDGRGINSRERSLCIMFGAAGQRRGLPDGWHPVRINGQFFYGNFVKVALNVLKDQPTEDRSVANVLTKQLRKLLMPGPGEADFPMRPRVRVVKSASAETWDIFAA